MPDLTAVVSRPVAEAELTHPATVAAIVSLVLSLPNSASVPIIPV